MHRTHTFRRPLAISAAALLGVGLAGLGAAPAHAVDVGDTAALNAAIAEQQTPIELSGSFALTANIATIDYSVEIIGNGYQIDAAGWDAFDLELGAGESASFTDVSVSDPGDYAVEVTLDDGASFSVSGGTFTEGDGILIDDDFGSAEVVIAGASFLATYAAIDVDDLYGTSAVDITGVSITDAYYGIEVNAGDDASVTIGSTQVAAGPVWNAGPVGNGDAIAAYLRDAAIVTVIDTMVTGEGTERFASGIYTDQDDESSVVVSDSTFIGSDFNVYASPYAAGTSFQLLGSTVLGGRSTGVYLSDMSGTAIIDETTIDDNSRTGRPNLEAYLFDSASVTVSRSTVSHGWAGGAYFSLFDESAATVINSTFSGNDAVGDVAPSVIRAEGFSDAALFQLLNSTVTANENVWAGVHATGVPGLIANTILSGNGLVDGGADFVGSGGGPFVVLEWDVIGSADGGAYGDGLIVTDDPGVGPLADNGGPTLTHALLPGSVALNTGNPAIADPPDTDQRGEPRILDGRIDIGSVEMPAVLPVTGAQPAPWLAVAALLVLLGGALIGARVRSRRMV